MSLLLKSIGAIAQFLLALLVARKFGAGPSGQFFYLLTLALVSGRLGRIGLDRTITRFVASFAIDRRWDALKELIYRTSAYVTIPAAAFALILGMILLGKNANGAPKQTEIEYLIVVTILLSTSMMFSQALQGLKLIVQYTITANISTFFVVGSLILLMPDVHALFNYLVVAVAVTFITALLFFWRATKDKKGGKKIESYKPILNSCIPLYFVATANILVGYGSFLFLGQHASQVDIGIFHVVNRLSLLITFPLIAVNAVIAPRFSELHHKSRTLEIFDLARKSANWLTLLVLPVILVLVFFSQKVLSLFGSEFQRGHVALSIMVLAQSVVLYVGPSETALVMTGNEKLLRNSAIMAGLVSAVANLVLIPEFGLIGAAVASATTYLTLAMFNYRYFTSIKGKFLKETRQ